MEFSGSPNVYNAITEELVENNKKYIGGRRKILSV